MKDKKICQEVLIFSKFFYSNWLLTSSWCTATTLKSILPILCWICFFQVAKFGNNLYFGILTPFKNTESDKSGQNAYQDTCRTSWLSQKLSRMTKSAYNKKCLAYFLVFWNSSGIFDHFPVEKVIFCLITQLLNFSCVEYI